MYLGLDLGTSALKGLLIDAAGQPVGSRIAPLQVQRPRDGWAEQDPASWISAAEVVVQELLQNFPAPMRALHGIGLSGQMHGATLLDKSAKIIRPCILWNDTRAHVEAAELDAMAPFRALTGTMVFAGFTAPKLLWVQRHEPVAFDCVHTVLLPKDYLRHWLTGEFISDMSDASGTGWLDVGARDWSDELLAATNMRRDQMPALVEGNAPAGVLRDTLARRWGLPLGITVAGGAGDNAAAAVGLGTIGAGQAFVSLGTSGVLFAARDTFAPNPASAVHTFCHALPDTWHQMGVILAAADALEWYANLVGRSARDLTGELGRTLRAPGSALFLPYLGGERTPHNDSHARGAFLGLSHSDDRPALTRAVLEGVAFALRDNLAALRATGTEISRLLAVGGGARSAYWLQVIATTLDLSIDVPKAGELGAAFGAARLGLMAATGADPASVCTPPIIAESVDPDTTIPAAFSDAYARWRTAYPALKGARLD
jgi:xylulokinase